MRAQTCASLVAVFGWIVLSACHWNVGVPSTSSRGSAAPAARSPAISVAMSSLTPVRPEPRVTLTASDGTGLRLVNLSVHAVVDEPLALTEMRLAFENPGERTLEGSFRITLPQGATVSRFAMRLGEVWQEGEVVELQAARRAYEDFLHHKQDPALLEQAAGSEFSARVFPIPAHGTKEIIVSYSQEIEAAADYLLPLHGLPELGTLDVEVSRAGSKTPSIALHDARVTPNDIVLPPGRSGSDGLRSGDLVLARVRSVVSEVPEPLDSTVVLVDTSASRALGFAEELNVLARVVGAVVASGGARAPLAVACFDQSIEPVFEGEAGGFGTAELARIEQRGPLGASDLERALQWAGRAAKKGGYKRVVLVTDGVATAGSTEDLDLVREAKGLGSDGVVRLDVLAVGGIRDDGGLRRLVTAGLAHDGVVADGGIDEATLSRRLTLATRSGVPVRVAGATWWWPKTLDGVQPGDLRSVYAEVSPSAAVTVEVDGRTTTPALRKTTRPLLERSWAQAKIASLLDLRASGQAADQDIPKQIALLSIAHRVTSPYTAMIVLETDADYARFRIDRLAVADILTVEGGAIAVAARRRVPLKQDAATAAAAAPTRGLDMRGDPNAPASPWARDDTAGPDPLSAKGNMWGSAIGDSFGAGGLGLSGTGEGGGGRGEAIGTDASDRHGAGNGVGAGFGSGHGRGAVSSPRAHVSAAPTVRQGATMVMGRVPPEIIQRTVRQRFPRLRACYEEGLRSDARLQGRVVVRFLIDRSGVSSLARDAGSDLPSPAVIGCVVEGFNGLSFPQPEGGSITVVYPIVFSPDGATEPTPQHLAVPLPRPPVATAEEAAPAAPPSPYTGNFRSVMDAIASGNVSSARALATEWHGSDPGDVLGLVALGESAEASNDVATAARAYGSIIDLFAARADLRRFAGERLERLRDGAGLDLAVDTYAKAKAERPDHPSSHRLLAFAWLKKGAYDKAFQAALDGMHQRYPADRFRGVDRILREDVGLIAAAWIHDQPKRRAEVEQRLSDAGVVLDTHPSLRFVLTWETDANDVDFHIRDGKGNHAFYGAPSLETGGDLYADVTTGYGPECFAIRKPAADRAGPYELQANYYARGPMGYGMGKLEIIDHDGAGKLTFEERPYVVMVDQAFVDLGTVGRAAQERERR